MSVRTGVYLLQMWYLTRVRKQLGFVATFACSGGPGGSGAPGWCEAPGGNPDWNRCYDRKVRKGKRTRAGMYYWDFAEVLISLTAACSQFLTLVSLSRTGYWCQKRVRSALLLTTKLFFFLFLFYCCEYSSALQSQAKRSRLFQLGSKHTHSQAHTHEGKDLH